VSITPDPKTLPYPLGGYVDPRRLTGKATAIHDTCYARALVLSEGPTKAALVSVELCFLPANVKTSVTERITATGIPASAVFLCATHTHAAMDPLCLHSANTGPSGALPQYDPKLLEFIAGRIAQSITEANRNLRPAKPGSGQMQNLGLNRNRRGEKVTDDEMTALRVDAEDGQPLAAVFIYAAHPVYYGAGMLEVSGDWSGAFQRQMEAVLPGAVVLFLNGAEGDASPNGADEGAPSEKIQVYSAKLCAKARVLYDSIATQTSCPLKAWTQEVQLPERKPHPLFLLAAGQLKATPQQARELVDRLMPTHGALAFLRMGDALLIGFPGEPTTPIGLSAKAAARGKGVKHPAAVALTNGWLGYLVSAEQYKAGKYEPTMSFYGEGIGEKMLEGVREGLNRY
jgi:hypothetical protein